MASPVKALALFCSAGMFLTGCSTEPTYLERLLFADEESEAPATPDISTDVPDTPEVVTQTVTETIAPQTSPDTSGESGTGERTEQIADNSTQDSESVVFTASGTITQHSSIEGVNGRSYEMVLGFAPDGGVIYPRTVSYPSLGCSGVLELINGSTFKEHITSGNCDDGGTFEISSTDAAGYTVFYEAPTGRYTSTGRLLSY